MAEQDRRDGCDAMVEKSCIVTMSIWTKKKVMFEEDQKRSERGKLFIEARLKESRWVTTPSFATVAGGSRSDE